MKYKKDIIYNLIFIFTFVVIYLLITHNGNFFWASKIDFEIQHTTISEYMRTLFYDTHNLFPSFAANIAGGENIYYLSYYGLFNPIVIISYLFPNISMFNYISFSMILVVLISTSLLYFYFRSNNYSQDISFICSFLFLCSAPLIFHSHRHIMFIDYFPFLILSFYGIDRFINKKKSLLLMISICLIILTSYYFSIACLVVIFIFGIYKYSKTDNKDWIKFLLSFILRFIIPISITSILTFPTLYVLLNGRSHSNLLSNIIKLYNPKCYLLYSHYSIGLTFISIISIIYAILQKNRSLKVLGFVIAFIGFSKPVAFLLNGFLYSDSKVIIPFILLVLIVIAEFLVFLLPKIKYKKLLIAYILIAQFIVCLRVNYYDELIEKDNNIDNNYSEIIKRLDTDNYRVNDSYIDLSYINKISDIKEYKTTVYSSTTNHYYDYSYRFLFENPLTNRNKFMLISDNNYLFESYMGEKYILTKKKLPKPYKFINRYKDINIYINDDVLPIGFSTNKYINEKDFNKLNYPDNIINILGRSTTKNKTNSEIIKTTKVDPKYEIVNSNNLKIKKTDDGYIIKAKDNGKLILKTNMNLDNKILFLNFHLDDDDMCEEEDLSIRINKIKNKLTCHKWKYYNENNNFAYTILDGNKLNISFNKGTYKISDINYHIIDNNVISDIKNSIIPFNINKNKTKGDYIVGDIDVPYNSMFILSVPYDDGFKILVNNKKVSYRKVNKSFIGFNLDKGNNNIEIKYTSPCRNLSFVICIIGLIIMSITIVIENINNRVKV